MHKRLQDRATHVVELTNDPDLDLSAKEVLEYTYKWLRYEIARRKKIAQARTMNKFAHKLNDLEKIYALRKELKHL